MSLAQSFKELEETISKIENTTVKNKKIRLINSLSTLIAENTLLRSIPFQEFSDLFETVRKSAILNIHENPITDAALFIKHTKSLQQALEIVRLKAFEVFSADQHKLRIRNAYPTIFENVEKAWKYPVFALPRANWNKHFLWTKATHAQIRLVGLYDEMKEDEVSYRQKNNLLPIAVPMNDFRSARR
jgi:hypothetical protein